MNRYLTCVIIFLSLILQSCTTDADDDSDNWDASVVCPETGMNSYGMPNRGEFTDERDGQVYKYTTIGNQVWMAENLRYDAEYSECNEVFEGFCETFGRYYSLAKDGKFSGPLDTSFSNHVCPKGWHVPEKDEWEVLFKNMGENDELVAIRLKSETYWGEGRGVGVDLCSFRALPAGGLGQDEKYDYLFYAAIFVVNSNGLNSFYESYGIDSEISNLNGWHKTSVRCLKD